MGLTNNMNFVSYAVAQALGPLTLEKVAATAIAHSDGSGGGGIIKRTAQGAVLGGAAGAGWQAAKKPAEQAGKSILKGGKTGAMIGAATLGGLALIKKLKQ